MSTSLSNVLDGITVVALAGNIPGPLAAARLHELGAHVVKIESQRGDPLQSASASWYAEIHRGLETLALDLRAERDIATVHERLANADLLLTAMRAGTLVRLGLGWEALHARYPRLSHVAVVGEAAPNDDRPGHDITYQARAGLLSPPSMPRSVVGDLAAAERAVTASLALLYARDKRGAGGYAQVAIVDAAFEFAAPLRHGLTGERDVLGGGFAGYAMYPAREGWVAVAALEPHFEHGLKELLSVDALEAPDIAQALLTRTALEWEALAEARDLPLAAVRTGALAPR
jgi:crotonobetainyl-CoA:carnitine CoA-transferase CaiB-like acyl-CoA transferase